MEAPRDILSKLIKKIAEEQKYVEYKADFKEISAGGASLTSALYVVTLSAKGKGNLNLFAKVALMGEKLRKEMAFPCPFTIELCFYTEVLKQFESLEKKHNIPMEHRLIFAKIYGKNDEYLKEMIVMENLEAQGFKCHDRFKSINLEYASKAIELMAKFHALSLALYVEDPQKYKLLVKQINYDVSGMEGAIDMMRSKMTVAACEVATEENRRKLEKYFATGDRFKEFWQMFNYPEPQLLLHGDFKASNLMHRRRNGKLEMIPVDFQMVRNASPVTELMYFLFTATDEEFRRQHYHKLLDHYYEQLSLALERLHVDPEEAYSEKTYRKELDENGKLEMIPVDFQMVRNASPVTELMYFLFTATDEEFRRQHYHKLLDHYYEQLSLALERLHVDPEEAYSEKTYRKELDELTMVGLMIGVAVLPMVVASEEAVPTFDEDSDMADFFVPSSEVFRERFNGLINNYTEWGLL